MDGCKVPTAKVDGCKVPTATTKWHNDNFAQVQQITAMKSCSGAYALLMRTFDVG